MRETVTVFGRNRNLVGIITHPVQDKTTDDQVAVILLNSGLLHRVGPNRLYVKIARELVSCGCFAVRFDLSGIGDSRSRTDGVSYEEGGILDTQDVMDYLARTHNIQKFVLLGICSGADNAYRIASRDPRVRGITLIDCFAFTSYGYYFSSYLKSLRFIRSWKRLLTGKSEFWGLVQAVFTALKTEDADDDFDEQWQMPPRAEIIQNLLNYAEQGGKTCFLYTETGPSYYNFKAMLQKPLRHLFHEQSGNRLEVIDNTDHLFTPLRAQKLVVKLIKEWIQSVFFIDEHVPRQTVKDYR